MSQELANLRCKIARWHLALQQHHVDREWPAIKLIMQEMAREAGFDSEFTGPIWPDTPSISTLPADKAICWGRRDGVWHAFGNPPDKSACRRIAFHGGALEIASPGTTVIGVVCDPCVGEWCIGKRGR